MTRAPWWLLAVLLGCTSGDAGDTTDDPFVEPDLPTGPAGLTRIEARPDETYPSVVHVSWEQEVPATVHLEFTFDDDPWHVSPERELAAGVHEELLLGVPFETAVTWRIVAATAEGASGTPSEVTWTGDAPNTLPVASLLTSDPASQDQAMDYILVAVSISGSLGSPTWTVLLDRDARAVWAHKAPYGRTTLHPRISVDGRSFLVDHSSFWGSLDGGAESQILDLRIDGTEVALIDVPGQHHAFTQLPDGSIAFAAARKGAILGTFEDAIVVVDPSGMSSELFRCDLYLLSIGETGWCGTNTLSYDEARDTFLFSSFTHEAVFEVDASTGEVLRTFGHVAGAWGFDPPSSAFWYQHGTVFTDAGTLLVSTHASETSTVLMAREYELDDVGRVLREVWSFGADEGVDGTQIGEAHRLPGGNTLQNHGTNAVVREFTTDGEVVWDVRWETREYQGSEQHYLGRSAPVTGSLYDFAPETRR